MAVAVSQADRGSLGGFVVEAAFCSPPFAPEVGGADLHRAPFRYSVLDRGPGFPVNPSQAWFPSQPLLLSWAWFPSQPLLFENSGGKDPPLFQYHNGALVFCRKPVFLTIFGHSP